MLRSFLLSCAAVASLVSVVAACGSGDVALGSQDDSEKTSGSSCQSAGGTCLLVGDDPCTTMAPTAAQDCNPGELPSGAFCCLSAGDGGSSTPADAGGADGGTGVTSCTWPSSLDPTDAGLVGQCEAARSLLSCKISGGATETCLSNDPSACPDDGEEPDASSVCVDQCFADEYGAECGFGPTASPSPPAGCRSIADEPSGTVLYCCACGT